MGGDKGKKKKVQKIPKYIWDFVQHCCSPLPVCSSFFSEEIEKSLRVFPLISMPVKDLYSGRRERSAKEGWYRSNTL